MASSSSDRQTYDERYSDPAGAPPWEIGGPQPALAAVLDAGVLGPRVLDAGCGTGDLALALARRGHDVTAFDVSPVAIERARAKAATAGLAVRFEVQDATRLSFPPASFDAVVDSGLLHSLVRRGGRGADDYLSLMPGVAAPGALVVVLAVSLEQGWGVTEEFLRAAFAAPHWAGTQVERAAVAARTGDGDLRLPGFLLRTRRSPA